MDLTAENKAHIDGLTYRGLLERWRYAPAGDPWFQGETGRYWGERMNQKRDEVDHAEAVATSKSLG